MSEEVKLYSLRNEYIKKNRGKVIFISLFSVLSILLILVSLFIGNMKIGIIDGIKALFGEGEKNVILVMRRLRLPRALAAFIVGFGLGISGLIMQTNLKNDMASPSTLGVSNASVLGANIAIIIISGGVVKTQNGTTFDVNNPYLTSLLAFLFAFGSIVLILSLSRIKKFNSASIILIGVALSAVFQAITTIIQYFAVDVRLTSAVFWSFGDLERGTMIHNLLTSSVTFISLIVFYLFSKSYNVMMMGDDVSKSLGVKVEKVRFISLLLASLIVAVAISIYGIIGFIGLMAPHIAKRLIGTNHKYSIIASGIIGAIILEVSDLLSRILLNGFTLPVGAITALFGAPFFLYLVFFKSRRKYA